MPGPLRFAAGEGCAGNPGGECPRTGKEECVRETQEGSAPAPGGKSVCEKPRRGVSHHSDQYASGHKP